MKIHYYESEQMTETIIYHLISFLFPIFPIIPLNSENSTLFQFEH